MQPQRTLEESLALGPLRDARAAPPDALVAVEQELVARELGLAAPRPTGPLSGRRRPWRWHAASAVLFLERMLIPPPLRAVLTARLVRSLEISRVSVPISRNRLGAGLELAFLSDLHAGFYMGADDLEELAELVMTHAPDLICLGGDLVDSRPAELHLLERFLRRLEAPLGVFAVLGNHEYYPARSADLCIAFLQEHGVEVLVNRGRRVVHADNSFWIAGVDDLTESEPDLAAALQGRRQDEPTLLLSHHPDLLIEAATHGVDLQLSGHTHGGQVRILGWQPLIHTRFGLHRGPFRHADTHLYVSRGVGVTVAPLRIDARPEVALVRWGGES